METRHDIFTRPLRQAALFAGALAYGGGLWMHLLHKAEGAVEHNEPGGVVHWLRDSTLALPLVFAAVWVGMWVAHRLLNRYGQLASRVATGATVSAVVAVLTSAVFAVSSPIHELLFGGRHGGHELPWYSHMLRDGLLALVANLAISAVVWALLSRRARGATSIRLGRAYGYAPVRAALAVVLIASVLLSPVNKTQRVIALADPGSPCPIGVPLKRFSVQAIDVDIPLNRFGDHDPAGKMYVFSQNVAAVRAQERNSDYKNRVSIGLHGGDAIQPLVMRANEGDCVEINFTNNASGGDYGIHIDGLAYDVASSGDAVGRNPSSAVARGGSRSYRYWIASDPNLEGTHYMRPGPGNRAAVNHGLFGALVIEPPGSTYFDPNTEPGSALKPLASGWEAIVKPGPQAAAGCAPSPFCPSFRENVIIYHEIGNEQEKVYDVHNRPLPLIDPHTHSYRPGSRALNYRSEPFMDRLNLNPDQKSVVYGSYTFGDPATPMPKGYLGDPTKQRILHAGSEVFHVHHLHGGGIRWRFNPRADHTYSYFDTGLNKAPKTSNSPSLRLDSQSIGPGESYNLEIEGGAGGVQQGAGEFLYHCHIAEHYFSGMWSFWRVFDTLQPDLRPLPDRSPLSSAVDSAELIGRTMSDGTKITRANVDAWIRPQLPPQGVKFRDPNGFSQDASVMNWRIDTSTGVPIYLGEPEDSSDWPDLPRIPSLVAQGHPGSLVVDRFLTGPNGNRPKILFNPINGRPAFPLLRPHIGDRPPFSPNGHSGAPYLGERGDQLKQGSVDPWANRKDGICPSSTARGLQGARVRHNNIVGITLPIQNTRRGLTDPNGALFVLAKDKADVYAHRKPSEPLALRANIGDCVFNTLTSEERDGGSELPFAKVNIHIHHVQFDTQASDGVISGFSFEQSVRPYKLEDARLTSPAAAGATILKLSRVTQFHNSVYFAVGEGTNSLEIRQIAPQGVTVTDPVTGAGTITLTRPLSKAHASGQWAGVEFVQYIWYPDVELDNIFFHDHVNGIFGWSHGMVGQFIVEPRGSTYHDPRTGKQVDSGTIVDIRTPRSLAPGVTRDFREVALWTIDNHSTAGSSLNLRAEPWADRGGDPSRGDQSLRFSSYKWGDPFTPLPRAYPGDPVVIRTINVGQGMQTLHVDGHRMSPEPRYADALTNQMEASPVDTIHYGISEKYTLVLEGGAGGPRHVPGDYLYNDGVERSFKQGAWGILRVLPGRVADLQPLPDNPPPAAVTAPPTQTGGRPPVASGPGNPCPAAAPRHAFAVSAVDLPGSSWGGGQAGRKAAYVPTAKADAIVASRLPVEPLVLHVSAGECVSVKLTNRRSGEQVSFHLGALLRDIGSSGVNVGYNPEQTVAPGQTRTYTYYADTQKLESTLIGDYGDDQGSRDGLYGAVDVAPVGATFTNPVTGSKTDVGAQVDVHVPGTPGYRDFTLVLADQDPIIGQSAMPYPINVSGPALVNYRTAGQRSQDANAFSSLVHGDPATPLLTAYRGDPMMVHVINAQGSEQLHTMSLGGPTWLVDANIVNSAELSTRAVGPQEKLDAMIVGGAGGRTHTVGDFLYQDRRLPFTEAGMWGLIRVLSDSTCPTPGPIKRLDGLTCRGKPSPFTQTTAP